MAFCTACGNPVDAASRFCAKCGAAMPATAVAPAASAPGQAPAKPGGGALKIVLIIAAVFVGLAVVIGGITAYIGYRAVKSARATIGEAGTTAHTAMGDVQTTKDPVKMAQETGVELYPGAEMVKEGSKVSFGGVSAASAVFQTGDAPEQVAEFYKQKYPVAMRTQQDDRYTIIATTDEALLTIAIEPAGGKTRIAISRTAKR